MKFLVGLLLVAVAFAQNPEEFGDNFEGDMIFEEGFDPTNPLQRNAVVDERRHWPNGEVAYEIVGKFTTSQLASLQKAFSDYRSKTCIRWVPKTSKHKNWVQFKNDRSGCFANVGKFTSSRPQVINLSSACFRRYGTVLHEMAHAIGFYHEQSRFDRDDFVVIIFNKIPANRKHNFNKYTDKEVTHLGAPYDYGSMMHYSSKAFGIGGAVTIVPRKPGVTLGQRLGFSPTDIYKINKMYKCGKAGFSEKLPPGVTWPSGTLPMPTNIPGMKVTVSNFTGTEFSCNFDTNMCGFVHDPLKGLRWSRHRGATPTSRTGPSSDHTTGKGYYMYTEASSQRSGTKALLMSPHFVTPGKRCLKFFYHMYGSSMGTLTVYKKSKNGLTRRLWTKSGNQRELWREAAVSVDIESGAQILFEGTIGSSFYSDMAIDDVSLSGSASKCVASPPTTQTALKTTRKAVTTTTQAPLKSTKPPTVNPELVKFHCTFDKDNCNFKHKAGEQATFDRRRGKTPSPRTGPSFDVSKLLGRPEGYYVYLEATGKSAGAKAGYISPNINVAGTYCLSFYYHMWDDMPQKHMGKLYIYSKSGSTRTQLFTQSGNRGDKWIRVRVTHTAPATGGIELEFVAERGAGFASDVSFDEITVSKGRC